MLLVCLAVSRIYFVAHTRASELRFGIDGGNNGSTSEACAFPTS
jgi:hypothetical protein